MRNLIVGCGYLGVRVATLWRQQGYHVLGTTRQNPAPDAFARLGIEPVLCDVLDPTSLKKLPAADTVLYAVGLDRSSGQTMRQVYVEGLRNVLEHLPPPGRFLYVSSSSVYGQTQGEWVDEDSVTQPEEESGKIVLEAEQVLRGKMPQAIILRFAGIYGPGRLLRQSTLQKGEPIVGDADKWLNLIHVEDGARAIQKVQELGHPGLVVNICDGQPVRRRDFYNELARLLKAPPPFFVPPVPGTPTPPHEKGNRRIRNDRLVEKFGFTFLHPSYREGLAQGLDSSS
jgi:nucleoside-diphosphate-sugar epimerase